MADDNEFWNKVDKHIADLEQRLGLPTNFLTEIADETPWSFIIKAHTLIEAAVGHVITNALGDTVLDQWATSLPLRGRHSKVSLLRQLTNIRKNDIQFIEALSERSNNIII